MFKKILHTIKEAVKDVTDRFTRDSSSLLFGIMSALVIIGPLFFIPKAFFPVVASKGFFIIIIALLGLMVWLVQIMRTGTIEIPRSKTLGILVGTIGISFIGTFFAPKFFPSLIGYGFETTSWIFLAACGLVTIISSLVVRSYERLAVFYGGFFFVGIVLIILQGLRFIFGPAFANLGVLFSNTASLIGSWNDLGIFLGLLVVLITITLEIAPVHKKLKIVLAIIGILGLLFLIIMNATMVLMIVGFIILITGLYLFTFAYWDHEHKVYTKNRKTPWIAFMVFTITLVGFIISPAIHNVANRYRSIVSNDIRPSFSLTLASGWESLTRNPITGSGPNTFTSNWNQVKPLSLSGTRFSEIDFSAGSGYFPTVMAENGALAIIGWIAFFISLLIIFVRRIIKSFENNLDRYVYVTLIALVVYLGITGWFLVPGAYLVALFAILVGSYFGISAMNNEMHNRKIVFIHDPRTSFFGILGITVIMVITVVGGYIIVRKASAVHYQIQGLQQLGQNNIDQAFTSFTRSARLGNNDTAYVKLAEISLQKVNDLIATSTEANKDVISRQIEQVVGLSLGYVNAAITLNPNQYRHHVLLGTIYQALVSLGVSDASDRSLQAYQQAEKLNPHDTTMKLLYANLALASNNPTQAKQYITDSINQFPTPSAFLLQTRMAVSEKNWRKAADSLEQVVAYNTNDVMMVVNLGIIQEKAGNYERANQIFTLLRNRFSDADQVINQVRNSFGVETIPETVEVSPSDTEAVAQ